MMFQIVGMGPGHPDYVLPAAKKALADADVIIGGKRHIEPFKETDKELIHVEGQLTKLPDMIRSKKNKKIVVAVSGDTGFYSLLSYMKKNFNREDIHVIPGISSLQYMYGRIGQVYQNSFIGSVHGRDLDFSSMVQDYETVGLLTDKKNTPSEIARRLLEEGIDEVNIYVGENLSYENEVITKGLPSEIKDKTFSDLVVVILERK